MAIYTAADFTFMFVRGHHIYKAVWTPAVGEMLLLEPEHSNVHDPQAVAVVKSGNTVGHALRGVARVFYFFIRHEGTITCEITGHA